MRFVYTFATDSGTKRLVNQDSVFVKHYQGRDGEAVMSVLCDGMGGLQHGEIASGSITAAFSEWADRVLPESNLHQLDDHYIRQEWTQIIRNQNEKLRLYGKANDCSIGSTVTSLLLTENRYFILNIGDTRAYRISSEVVQITEDHTVIAEEIRRGNISEKQAAVSPIRSVLTRCVGVSAQVYPDMFFGATETDTVYLLCSDGFRHKISKEEMREQLLPVDNDPLEYMRAGSHELILRNKMREETDNISVITIFVE